MRFFVAALILGVALLANAEEPWIKDKPVIENCMKETGASPEALIAAYKSKMTEVDEKTKCVLACYFKTKGFIKPDGTIDGDKASEALRDNPKMNKEGMINAVKACGGTKGENDCETAYNTVMCVKEKMKP